MSGRDHIETLAPGDAQRLRNTLENRMESLAEALPREQARCRTILEHTLEAGPAGAFAAAIPRQSLARAERAAAEGDLGAMIAALNDLQSYSE